MSPERDPIDALLASISDGHPVDWDVAAGALDPEERIGLDSLRDISKIADFSRRLQLQPEVEVQPERWGDLLLLERIGGGSQAEVFRAWDPGLRRDVALKVMRSGGEGGALMEEGRAAARIRHPHVVTVHGIDIRHGRIGLSMELIRGTSLEQEVRNRGPLTDGEAIQLGVQIASALSAVHEAGLLHRDIKPANVVRDAEGRYVLADFGLGLRWDQAALTAAGPSGTPMYMAPELLAGVAASERSDVYSLGLLLWFALVGRHPFDATTLNELKLATERGPQPPVAEACPDVSSELGSVIERAIAPDLKERFGSARELLAALEGLPSTTTQERLSQFRRSAALTATSARPRGLARLAWGAVALAAIVAVLASVRAWQSDHRQERTSRFELSVPAALIPLGPMRVSPSGTAAAFAATDSSGVSRLYVRTFDALECRALPGTEGAGRPFWSPDGRQLGFIAGEQLKKILVSGGRPEVVCSAPHGSDGCWTTRNMILFDGDHTHPNIRMVSASGGTPREITKTDTTRHELTHFWPEALPDGEHFLYAAASTQGSLSEIRYARIGAGNGVHLMPGTGRAEFADPGFVLFVRENTLIAQRLDTRKGRLVGEPRAVAEQVGFHIDNSMPYFSTSRNGMLLYSQAQRILRHVVLIDGLGRVIEELAPPGLPGSAAMSPNARLLAYEHEDVSGQGPDIWIRDLVRGVSSRFTTNPLNDVWPVWSPDSRTLYWCSTRGDRMGVYRREIDRVGRDSLFFEGAGPVDLSADGRYLACMTNKEPPWDAVAVSIRGRQVVPIAVDPQFNEGRPRFSPDGRWVVFDSDRTGRQEVYLQAFPGPAPPIRISNQGGWMAFWSRDGREILYREEDAVMAVSVTLGPRVTVGVPRLRIRLPMPGAVSGVGRLSMAPDGRGFIATVDATPETPWRPVVVTNWMNALPR